ncbi:MAG: threonine ammonia-lyase [Thermodesulfobacteriota bacterium]
MTFLKEVESAASGIEGQILRTPLVISPTFSRIFGAEIYLKLENLQNTGSFKIRGATHKLVTNLSRIGAAGVVAASAGNHAQGVALAAGRLGIHATIVMPEWASISKQEAARAYGGSILIFGKSVDESLAKAKELAENGAMLIHPFDDPEVIAGQGTIGLEILSQLHNPDLIVTPVGGGGLISGIAAVAKSINPGIKIIGVQTRSCPSAIHARRNNAPLPVGSSASLADGINVKKIGDRTFEIIQKYVDDLVAVPEESIASAVLMLLERKKILAEGAGAVPLAALLEGLISVPPGGRVVLVISGGNIDTPLIGRILNQGLTKHSRIMRLSVILEDIPGSLASFLEHLARLKANVLHIRHDRNLSDLPFNLSRVALELETRGAEHIDEIAKTLIRQAYQIELS